jgi:hypothetical protein
VPEVNPVMAMLPDPDCTKLPVTAPGDDVAMYLVMALPPLLSGDEYETLAVVAPVT